MIKESGFIKKSKKYKRTSLFEGQFFCDQNLLENQMTFDDIQGAKTKEEETAEMIGEANQEVARHGTKKKKIINLVFFLINSVVVACILIFQLFNSEVQGFDEIISSGNFRGEFIIVILIAFAALMFLDSHRATYLLKRSSKRSRPALCYKLIAIGRYYDCITPMSTGGQPFQVFYLNKRGMDAGAALSIPLARSIVFQIAWITVGIFAIVYSTSNFAETTLVSVASYLGFALDGVLLIGIWALSVGKTGRILVVKCLKLLCKMKIIKSYEKVYDKVMTTVKGFQSTMKDYTRNIWAFLLLIVSQLTQLIIQFAIPYFIYLLLGGEPGFNIFITIWVYSVLVEFASGFMPVPGGTGVAEVGFTIVLTPIFPDGTVFWGLLLWRFMNFYIYLIQGIMVMIYDNIWGNKKYQWQKKKWELEAESTKFKQDQLKKYNKRSKSGKIRI